MINPYGMPIDFEQETAEQKLMRELEERRQMQEKYAGNILPRVAGPSMPQPANVRPPMAPPAQPSAGPRPNASGPRPNVSGPRPSAPRGNPAPTQSRGLLDMIGLGGVPTGDIFTAIGSGMLGLSGNQGLQQMGMAGFEQLGKDKETRKARAQLNKTVQALRDAGRNDLANAVESGMMKASDAANILFDKGGDMIQQYEYAKQQGYKGSFAEFKKLSASTTNINTGDIGPANADYLKASNKALAEYHMSMVQAGSDAMAASIPLAQLEGLNFQTPDGFMAGVKAFAGEFGITLGEGVDNVQAMRAIINRLVPQQRPPGSGPMSDADLELFKQSLPQLMQEASGRQLIIDLMKQVQQYDMARGQIAEMMLIGEQNGGISQEEGRKRLRELQENTVSLAKQIGSATRTEEVRDF